MVKMPSLTEIHQQTVELQLLWLLCTILLLVAIKCQKLTSVNERLKTKPRDY